MPFEAHKTVTNSERMQVMIRSRLRLNVLLLSSFVLGIMAFATAGAAQAETGATWRVNGANVTTLLPEVGNVIVEELLDLVDKGKHVVLTLTTKGGTKVEFLCTSITTPGVRLAANGSVDLGKVTFHGCITKLNGAESKNCEPHTGLQKGLITTLNGVGLIILHNSEPLTRIVPDPVPDPTNKVLAHIELSELCSIGEEVLVTGQLTLKDSGGKAGFEAETVEHLIEPGPLTELMALGVNATLKGSAKISLVGASHVGLKWSGKPA